MCVCVCQVFRRWKKWLQVWSISWLIWSLKTLRHSPTWKHCEDVSVTCNVSNVFSCLILNYSGVFLILIGPRLHILKTMMMIIILSFPLCFLLALSGVRTTLWPSSLLCPSQHWRKKEKDSLDSLDSLSKATANPGPIKTKARTLTSSSSTLSSPVTCSASSPIRYQD